MTVAALNIYANDVLELQTEPETVESESGLEEAGSQPREEGNGFRGTLLTGRVEARSSSPVLSDQNTALLVQVTAETGSKPCSRCTLSNEPDAVECAACCTPFV